MRKRNNRRNNFKRNNEPKHILNDRIRFKEVRLVGDDIESTVMSIDDAREMAEREGLDLMLVTEKGNPPVVRLCDYQKFLYQEKRKQKEMEQKQKEHNKDMKEMRFTPNISEHDIEVKKKKIIEFLESGHKVKMEVRKIYGRGERLNHLKESSEKILLKITVDLEDISKADSLPKLNGRNMSMILSPKK